MTEDAFMKTKLSAKFWCAITLFSLIGQVAWVVENMYFNVFIYNMFRADASDISLMVAASAVAATLTTVFMGALSDKIGKRKLFICAGYILWGISILCFTLLRTDLISAIFPMTVSAATLGITLTIILDCVMTFFGSTANDAAFNAWVTDSTDRTNRGAVEGINSMIPLVAILAVFGGFMFFDLTKEASWTLIFLIIGVIVIGIGILGIFIIKEPNIKPTKEGYVRSIFYGFLPSTVKQNPLLYLILILFTVFNISIQVFMPYLIIYYEHSLGMSNYVFIMAPAIVLAAVFTAFWGKTYDKKGFQSSIVVSLLSLCIGYIILYLTSATVPVFIGSLLMMCGYLASMAVFGAIIRDLTPEGKAGMFQGLRICFQVLIPGIVGPFIGSLVLRNAKTILNSDGTTSFLPNANIFLAALICILALVPLLLYVFGKTKPKMQSLRTPFEEDLGDVPYNEYPRPQCRRDSFLPLNGVWDLRIVRGGKPTYEGPVLVPFPIESRLSGVERSIDKYDRMYYSRSFTVASDFLSEKTILHFGAVDQICRVFINGIPVGEHIGGYVPFSFDVTKLIKTGENTVTVEVTDPLDPELPYGKQRKKRGGMWYTPVSGIWQSVWMESIPADAIDSIRIESTLDSATIYVKGGTSEKTLIFEGKEHRFTGDCFTLTPERPERWSPEHPKLYEFEILSGNDRVQSYFALRTVRVKDDKILLNEKPYFFHGLLDQGYFSDGIYLPATPKGFENDILQMKSLGFNMLRKHIKIEPELFYYYCDKHGMIVFQDFVNSGKYNFLIDTALPTVGPRKGITHRASKYRREQFEKCATEMVEQLNNHPCVCYYTIFNEGWGQYDADLMYKRFKALDPNRVWDSTSGWFKENESDVESEHIYFKPIKLFPAARPLVLSEFGGYSLKIKDHSFNTQKTYGYKLFEDKELFTKAMEELYCNEILPAIENGLCATVLTQVSDVEDETNGLLTYDRQVLKVDRNRMQAISNLLYSTHEKKHSKA